MKTTLCLFTLLLVFGESLNGQIQKVNDILIKDWYNTEFANKKININDTLVFEDFNNCKENCSYLKWTFKNNGILVISSLYPFDSKHEIATESENYKWFIDNKNNNLSIYKMNLTEIYKIQEISIKIIKVIRIK